MIVPIPNFTAFITSSMMSSYSDSENESFGGDSPASSYSIGRSSSSSPSPIPVSQAVETSSSKAHVPQGKASSSKTPAPKGKTSSSKPSTMKNTKATPSRPTPTTKEGLTSKHIPQKALTKPYTKLNPPSTIPSIKPFIPPHESILEFLRKGLVPVVSYLVPLTIEPFATIFVLDTPALPLSIQPSLSSPNTPPTIPAFIPPLPLSLRPDSPALEPSERPGSTGAQINASTLA